MQLHCFLLLVWVGDSYGLEFGVAHIDFVVLALVKISIFLVLTQS
jgi:hypothetical protein